MEMGEVMEKFLGMLEEAYGVYGKVEEMRKAFVDEFGIEPDVVTPNMARKSIRLLDKYTERCDNIRRAVNACLAHEDEDYEIVLLAERLQEDIEDSNWKPSSIYPSLAKVKNGIGYSVSLLIVGQDDDC